MDSFVTRSLWSKPWAAYMLGALAAGCASQKQPGDPPAPVAPAASRPAEAPPAEPAAKSIPASSRAIEIALERIHFDFDSSLLNESARATLRANEEKLRSAGQVGVVIEGHCDDVGTTEYNLALGERRADAARRYLQTLGVSPERIRIVSYGEVRPLISSSSPDARSKNRRAELSIR